MSRCSLFPLLLLGITAAGAAPLEPLRVASFSVGQGHSTLLRSGDFAVLIDGSKPSAGPPVVAYVHHRPDCRRRVALRMRRVRLALRPLARYDAARRNVPSPKGR